MDSQRNKYVWTKNGPPSGTGCDNKDLKSQSKYKFIRNGAIYGANNCTMIPPSNVFDTSQNMYNVKYQSIRGVPRGHSRRIYMTIPKYNSGSRFKYVKGNETTREQLTVRNYSSPHSISRTCAMRTLYKYAKSHSRGIAPKVQAEKLALRNRYTNITGYSRYKYIRIRSTYPTSRANVAADVRANPSTGGKRSHIWALHATSKSRKNLTFHRKPMCTSYIMNGMCGAGSDCSLEHDENYIRICPRYLHHRCALGRFLCPLAHVLDPCRLPVCEFYAKSDCNRVNCPYIHTSRSPDTPICPQFQRGRCPSGRMCSKLHVWLTKNSRKSAALLKKKLISPIPCPASATGTSVRQVESPQQPEPSSLTSEAPMYISLALPETPLPEGSLRNVFPAPDFIPLLDDE